MLQNTIVNRNYNIFINFVWTRIFGILDHNILPALIALRFDFAAHNPWTEFFGLKSNVSEILWSDLLVLCCFTGTDGPDDIGMFSVDTSRMDTMAPSIIAFYCLIITYSSQFVYIFYFSRHLSLYKYMLLNY